MDTTHAIPAIDADRDTFHQWVHNELTAAFTTLSTGKDLNCGYQYRLEGIMALLLQWRKLEPSRLRLQIEQLYQSTYQRDLDANWWDWQQSQQGYPLPFWMNPAPTR